MKNNESQSKHTFKRSRCSIANTLDIVGDKWTLVVLRDLFNGKCRYADFLKSSENIPTNILAERLKRLEKAQLLEKCAYQTNPIRYEYTLTSKGTDFLPVLQEMARWAIKHMPETWTDPDFMKKHL